LFRAHADAQWGLPVKDLIVHGDLERARVFPTSSGLPGLPGSVRADGVRAGGPDDPPSEPGKPDLGESEDVDVEDKPISTTPRRFKVIFHNDDYTTQEFVIYALIRFFHKSEAEARHIMLTVHHKGAAVAGVYTKDVAETKAQQVMDVARENGMPLLLTTEPE
jgi:ATP-dependent Clp protease adaptor protein ClpS